MMVTCKMWFGYDNIDDYVNTDNNLGATIGTIWQPDSQWVITVEGVEYQRHKITTVTPCMED